MAVTLTGAGGLFTRLGVLEGFASDVKVHQLDIDTEVTDVLDEYNANREFSQALEDGRAGFKQSAGAPLPTIRGVSSKTLIEMVQADNPQPSKDLISALREIINQMEGAGGRFAPTNDVDGNTVGSSHLKAGTAVGSGELIVSVTDVDGLTYQHSRAEKIIVEVTKDAQISGTAGRDELWSVRGEPSVAADDPLWPRGSGISSTLRITAPDRDAQSTPGQNTLTNSDFEDFSPANTPSNWPIAVGGAGTTIFEATGSNKFRGSKGLEIRGDAGGTLTSISQQFNTSGQTLGKLRPRTKYALVCQAKDSGAGLVAGEVRIRIKDGAGAIVNDAAGNPITLNLTAAGLGAGFTQQLLIFGTGYDVPDTVKLHVEVTTALTSGQSIYIDDLVLVQMPQVGGPNSPHMIVMPGGTAWVQRDRFTVTVTNDKAGGFQQAADRWWNMYGTAGLDGRAFQLPYDIGGTETILDTLIS